MKIRPTPNNYPLLALPSFLVVTALLYVWGNSLTPPASACDPDHVELVTITDTADIAEGGTGTVKVAVTCVVDPEEIQAGKFEFESRVVDADENSDTILSVHQSSIPAPDPEAGVVKVIYTFDVALGCPNRTIASGPNDSGEGSPDSIPCSDPADIWVEIDRGRTVITTNLGHDHITSPWPGTAVTAGEITDSCCVPTATNPRTSVILDEKVRAFLSAAAAELIFESEATAGVTEELSRKDKRKGKRSKKRARRRRYREDLVEELRDPDTDKARRKAIIRQIKGYLELANQTPLQQEAMLQLFIKEFSSSLRPETGISTKDQGAPTISIDSTAPWVKVEGPLNADGTFVAVGQGDFLFLRNVAARLEGRITAGRFRGAYTLGPGNTLPGDMSLTFDMSIKFPEWDDMMSAIADRFLNAAIGMSALNLPTPVGGVDYRPFAQNIASHLMVVGHGFTATLDDDEIAVIPPKPMVEALGAMEAEFGRWADSVAGSELRSRAGVEQQLRLAGRLFGEAAAIQDQVNALRAAPPSNELVDEINNLLAKITEAAGAMEEVSRLAFGVLFTTVSAADFSGPQTAANAIVSGFAANLTDRIEAAAQVPLPTALADVSLEVTDSLGESRLAGLFFGSGGQFNYHIPPDTAPGVATVTAFKGDQVIATGRIFVQATAPSIFSANSNGAGVAAAVVLRVAGDGTQSTENIFSDGAAGSRTAVPITFNAEDERLFLLLFGTAIRGGQEVRVLVNGQEAPVLGFAASGEFVGLDQVNIELLRALVGAGIVTIEVIVDGITANVVTINMG